MPRQVCRQLADLHRDSPGQPDARQPSQDGYGENSRHSSQAAALGGDDERSEDEREEDGEGYGHNHRFRGGQSRDQDRSADDAAEKRKSSRGMCGHGSPGFTRRLDGAILGEGSFLVGSPLLTGWGRIPLIWENGFLNLPQPSSTVHEADVGISARSFRRWSMLSPAEGSK